MQLTRLSPDIINAPISTARAARGTCVTKLGNKVGLTSMGFSVMLTLILGLLCIHTLATTTAVRATQDWLTTQQTANELLFQILQDRSAPTPLQTSTSKQHSSAISRRPEEVGNRGWGTRRTSALHAPRRALTHSTLSNSAQRRGIRIRTPGVLSFEHVVLSELNDLFVIASNQTNVTGICGC